MPRYIFTCIKGEGKIYFMDSNGYMIDKEKLEDDDTIVSVTGTLRQIKSLGLYQENRVDLNQEFRRLFPEMKKLNRFKMAKTLNLKIPSRKEDPVESTCQMYKMIHEEVQNRLIKQNLENWIFLWVGSEQTLKPDEQKWYVGKGYKTKHEAHQGLVHFILYYRGGLKMLWDSYFDFGRNEFLKTFEIDPGQVDVPQDFTHFVQIFSDILIGNVHTLAYLYDECEICEVIQV